VAEILQLRGPRAASESRLAKLIAVIRKSDPGARSAAAEYRYLVQTSRVLSPEELRLVERLLDDGSPKGPSASGTLYLVVPRLGTISPWSSKATDIARNCGLSAVKRIERAIAYYVAAVRECFEETGYRVAPAADPLYVGGELAVKARGRLGALPPDTDIDAVVHVDVPCYSAKIVAC